MKEHAAAIVLGSIVLTWTYFGSLPEPQVTMLPQAIAFPASGAEAVAPSFRQFGRASWYKGSHKLITANGEHFDSAKLTAAHRTLPFNTVIRVTNLQNARSVVLRVNDRGPYAKGRIIDLSAAAALALGMKHDGVVPVQLEVIDGSQSDDEKVADNR